MIWLFTLSCNRPSSNYEVSLVGQETTLDSIQAPAEPMSGLIEYARFRLYGKALGHGFTGLYGDTPYASGSSFVIGMGSAAYPPSPSFDRTSSLFSKGPAQEDSCYVIMGPRSEPWSMEYIDLGDTISLTGPDFALDLPRDPTIYPTPAGETWYIGYGNQLKPVLTSYPHGSDTWPSTAATLEASFPGTLPPEDTMVGAIPSPGSGSLSIPQPLNSVRINGLELNEAAQQFKGPWTEQMLLSWLPSTPSADLTLSIRAIQRGEAQGSCVCDDDCSSGLSCNEGSCYAIHGSSDAQVGELVCSLKDDGEYSLSPSQVSDFLNAVQTDSVGYLLVIGRMAEDQISQVPDTLTHNGKRLSTAPIRTRGIDAIITRLEAP